MSLGIAERLFWEAFANQVKEVLQEVEAEVEVEVEVEVAKRSDLHQFKVTPKRWVVERSCKNAGAYGRTLKGS